MYVRKEKYLDGQLIKSIYAQYSTWIVRVQTTSEIYREISTTVPLCLIQLISPFSQIFQKRELVKDFGVYVKFVDLELFEQSSKSSATGLMRNLIGIWYTNARLAACSATSGINPNIRTAVFSKLNLYMCLLMVVLLVLPFLLL